MKRKGTILFGATNNFFKEILSSIANELVKRGYKVIMMSTSKLIYEYFQEHSPKADNVYVNEEAVKLGKAYSRDELEELYEKYDFDEKTYFFREIEIVKRRKEKLRKYTYGLLIYIDSFFKDNKIDHMINCGEGLFNICLWLASKKKDIEYYHTNWLGYISGQHYWDSDINRFTWIKKGYIKENLTKKDMEETEAYLNRSKKTKKVQGFRPQRVFTFYFFKKFIMYFYNYYKTGPGRIENYSPPTIWKRWVFRFFKSRYYKWFYEEEFNPDMKYFYFPLHLYYDASIALSNQKFYRQDHVAKMIADCLPKDYILVTKEHPIQRGITPRYMMKNIKKIKNVKIVSAKTNSHDIIKNSVGIITICSSVGWEALQYGKPVITLAETFYDHPQLVHMAKSQNELRQDIKKVIRSKLKPNKKALQHMVHAFIKSHHDCNYFKDGSTTFDRGLSNIKKLVDVVEWEIDYRKKHRKQTKINQ